jgi:hypothetical protein
LLSFAKGLGVIVNAIIPAVVRDQAIDRGEIDAGLPFRGRYRGRWIGRGFGMDVHGESSLFEGGTAAPDIALPWSRW